jgi:hypothetical protein
MNCAGGRCLSQLNRPANHDVRILSAEGATPLGDRRGGPNLI